MRVDTNYSTTKMKSFVTLSVLCVLFVVGSSKKLDLKASFDNYRVYTLSIDNEFQRSNLEQLQEMNDGYQFWEYSFAVGSKVNVQVPPHKFADFSDVVNNLDLDFELLIENLQEKYDQIQPVISTRAADFDFENYHRLDDIYNYLDYLVQQYPGVVTKINAGMSHELRPIYGVKISFQAGNKGVFLEAGMHAREWIGVASAVYILNDLMTSDDADIRRIAQNYDWYFVPVTNPDGYEYSHTTNRNWRKTRFPHGILCTGADPNRNWAYQWGVVGSSSNPCSDIFHGPEPFSEIETRTLSEYYTTVAENINIYISFHSFSQLLLIPFGHTADHLGNYDDAMAIGRKAVDKLAERHGTIYQLGNIAETIYQASGGSIDWIKAVQGTPLTYCYELRDTGVHGFVLPPEQIAPTSHETLDSMIAMLDEAAVLGY